MQRVWVITEPSSPAHNKGASTAPLFIALLALRTPEVSLKPLLRGVRIVLSEGVGGCYDAAVIQRGVRSE